MSWGVKCLSLADFPGTGAWNAIRVLPRVWLCHAHGAALGILWSANVSHFCLGFVLDLSASFCDLWLWPELSPVKHSRRISPCGLRESGAAWNKTCCLWRWSLWSSLVDWFQLLSVVMLRNAQNIIIIFKQIVAIGQRGSSWNRIAR